MAVRIQTSNPAGLLATIRNAFANSRTMPPTWRMDSYNDLTHTPEQWDAQAWFRSITPQAGAKELVFIFKTYDFKKKRNADLFPYYHGRFVEMLISHFSSGIQDIIVSSSPSKIDELANE